MYAAFRVWRGSIFATVYGGIAVLVLILFATFIYALAEIMRH